MTIAQPTSRCRCSHGESHHYVDRRGKVVCRSTACGCAEYRPEQPR